MYSSGRKSIPLQFITITVLYVLRTDESAHLEIMQFYANNCQELGVIMIGLQCPIITMFQLQYQSVWELTNKNIFVFLFR